MRKSRRLDGYSRPGFNPGWLGDSGLKPAGKKWSEPLALARNANHRPERAVGSTDIPDRVSTRDDWVTSGFQPAGKNFPSLWRGKRTINQKEP
jgi:hypothetical protein